MCRNKSLVDNKKVIIVLIRMMEERKRTHGLCECILGRRPDMCSLPDFNGKDENAAGTDYGAIGMFRSCFGSNRCISTFRGICRGGSIGAIVRLWQYAV